MASRIMDEIERIWDLRDKRNDGWALMDSPFPTLALCFGYYYVVRVAGPSFMANRKAYELRRVLMVYNLFQIVFNCWLFYELGMSGWFGRYNYFCQPVDYSETDEHALRALRAGWWYFLSKFVDFFDTFFFVLRKKDRQITTLHLYHHGMMPIFIWPGIRYVCGGHALFFAYANSLVHIVMYFYYLMAAMGPAVQRFLWWKKYLTTFQMAQFVFASFHCFQVLFMSDCNFPKGFVAWIGFHEVCYLALFANFYRSAYIKPAAESINNNNVKEDQNNNDYRKGTDQKKIKVS